MARNGISIRPTMMKLGSTTPAYHGSKNTSISCKPRKYHGAFEGFGVRVGLLGSSSGALMVSDQIVSTAITSSDLRISLLTKNGQVWIFSSMPDPSFLIEPSIRSPRGAAAALAPPADAPAAAPA